MLRCLLCGFTNNRESDKFCINCGVQLSLTSDLNTSDKQTILPKETQVLQTSNIITSKLNISKKNSKWISKGAKYEDYDSESTTAIKSGTTTQNNNSMWRSKGAKYEDYDPSKMQEALPSSQPHENAQPFTNSSQLTESDKNDHTKNPSDLSLKDAIESPDSKSIIENKKSNLPISNQQPETEDALKILKIRFAKGEITEEQFLRSKKLLEE